MSWGSADSGKFRGSRKMIKMLDGIHIFNSLPPEAPKTKYPILNGFLSCKPTGTGRIRERQ